MQDKSDTKIKLDKKQSTSAILSLLKYSKKHIPLIILSFLLALVGTGLNVLSPQFLAEITNIISAGLGKSIDIEAIIALSVTLSAIYLFSFVFTSVQGVIMAWVSQRITRNLRGDIARKINKIPLNYFDTTSTGDIMSRITNDVDLISQTLNQSLITLIIAAITFLGATVMMFITNVIMAITAIIATFIGFGLMMLIISKSQKYFEVQQKMLGRINGHVEETYSGQNIVKVYNGEKMAVVAFNDMNNELYNSAWKSQFMSGLMHPLMAFIGNFGYAVVSIVGAVLAVSGHISFGVIVAFMLYIRMFTNPLAQLAQIATTMQTAAAASNRVFEFLAEQEIVDKDVKSMHETAKGQVSFRHVRFGYTPEKTIINDFSMDVKAGQKIAIVGPTGAGKSTLINLLMRFYELNSGQILIDGEDIRTLSYESLREKFCMVLQDTWLFEGSIRENILYSNDDVSDEQLKHICKSVGLHHFIKTLPKSYDTVLNEATTISQGQKQLITIARAMIANANMLILDEATSSVDTRTELIIQQAMDKLMQGKTSFVIAHRLSTIKNADVILVLKDGDVIESGSHGELMALNGFYANLYNSQFGDTA